MYLISDFKIKINLLKSCIKHQKHCVCHGSITNVALLHAAEECRVFPKQCSGQAWMCSKDDWCPLAAKCMCTDTTWAQQNEIYPSCTVVSDGYYHYRSPFSRIGLDLVHNHPSFH